jgi:hypothetical protein
MFPSPHLFWGFWGQSMREVGATCHSIAYRATGGCFTSFVVGPQFFLVIRRA